MKLARQIRFSIIKFKRDWKRAFEELWSEIKFALEPIAQICKSARGQNGPNNETQEPGAESMELNESRNADQNESTSEQKRPKWKWNCFLKLAKIFEVVAFISAAITVWVIYLQFQQERRSSQLDERAWVFAYKADCRTNTTIPETFTFKVYIKNTGKTPALNVRTYIEMDAVTNTGSITNMDDERRASRAGVIAPDATIFSSPGGYSKGVILEDAFNQYISTGCKVYIFGTIWYDDIFGHNHWSQYCVQVVPSEKSIDQFEQAEFHNSCDDAQTNQTNKK